MYALGDLSFRHESEICPDVPVQRLDWANGPWREKLDAVVKAAQGQTLDLVLFSDGLHPNPAGYERAAVEIEKLMDGNRAPSTR